MSKLAFLLRGLPGVPIGVVQTHGVGVVRLFGIALHALGQVSIGGLEVVAAHFARGKEDGDSRPLVDFFEVWIEVNDGVDIVGQEFGVVNAPRVFIKVLKCANPDEIGGKGGNGGRGISS